MTKTKNAKYRVKNGSDQYEVVHFETSIKQVQGLTEELAGKALESEVSSKISQATQEIQDVENTANSLGERLTIAEGQVRDNAAAIKAEERRAEGEEGRLKAEIAGIREQVSEITGEEGLEGLKTLVQTNTSNLEKEVKRAQKAEGDLEGKVGQKLDTNTFNQEVQALRGEIASKATEENLQSTIDEGNRLLGLKEDSSQVTIKVDASLVEAKAHADRQMEAAKKEAEEAIALTDARVGDLNDKVSTNTNDISGLKRDINGKNSKTQVYESMEQFVAAADELHPKKGDLVFVIKNKKSFIYKNEDAAALAADMVDGQQIPEGWVLFDNISTELDLSEYAKNEAVQEKVQDLTGKVQKEERRATDKENLIAADVAQANSNLNAEKIERGNAVSKLEGDIERKEKEIEKKITDNAPTIGTQEPSGKGLHHIWIDTTEL